MTETWAEILEPQWVDLAMMAGFIVLAMVSFFRKSVPLKYVTLVVAVVYLGLAKSDLISIVNIYGLGTGGLPIFKYTLAWYLFAGFTVVSTVIWGRIYCGRVCAFGALTQLMDRAVPAKWRYEVPAKIEQQAAWIKYGILAVVIAYFIVMRNMAIYQYVEPFWMFGIGLNVSEIDWTVGTTGMWVGLGVLLLATVFVKNLYCRFLCPLGAFLGLISKLTVLRIPRWKECNSCKICEKACEWGAIQGPKIVMTECVRCDDCERLYADQKKCPHWLIILRKKPEPRPVPTA